MFIDLFLIFFFFFRLKKIQKEKPWTLEDARGMGVDNGKPLGRAPKPIPIAPGEAGNATAATTTTNATQNPPPKTTEGEDITFTF